MEVERAGQSSVDQLDNSSITSNSVNSRSQAHGARWQTLSRWHRGSWANSVSTVFALLRG